MIEAYIDGQCAPNPYGVMSYAYVLKRDKQIISAYSGYSPPDRRNSNNTAEYLALFHLIRYLVENNIKEAKIYSDSSLLVNQMNRKWGIKGGKYVHMAVRCFLMIKDYNLALSFYYVPESKNEAHPLAVEELRLRRLSGYTD